MQSKTPLLMVTALVCGLGAAFGTWKLVSGATNAPADEVKVKVLVPVADVAPYHLFQDAQRFTEMEWPKSRLREVEEDTIKSFDQLKGRTSRHYKLKPNEPIYKNDICESMENDVSERLQNGEVAHAVPVSAERAAGGFAQVGDRLDISATVQPGNGETAIRTFFFLEDVEVLAVDNTAQKNMNNMTTPPTRFLLRLTRPQSLVMKFFQDTAKIDFVKRKQGDKTRISESFYFTSGKKTSGVPGPNDDQPDPTVAINIQEQKLPDPVDEAKNRTTAKQDQINPGDLTEEQKRQMKHRATINVDGTTKVVDTNATFEKTEIVKKKDDGKKDETKKDDGKKDDSKTAEGKNTPGQ